MKHSKKVVAVLLTGTLAFSSIGAVPMMAFADEAATQEQATDDLYTDIVDGTATGDMTDADGNPVLEGENWGVGVIGLGRGTSKRNNKGYYNEPVCNVFLPTVNPYQVGSRNNGIYFYGEYSYPRYSCDYSRYNGRMSLETYRSYALASVYDVKMELNKKHDVGKDMIIVSECEDNIRAARSTSAIDAELREVQRIANKNGIRMYTDWYLPYDYDYRRSGCGYSYNYRPCDYKDYKEEKKTVNVYRLLNPANGDHVYNSSSAVRDKLIAEGWKSEGNAWKALEDSSKPVYQLRNTVTGRYHYTTNATERDNLVANKWENDGVAFYGSDSNATKVYRVLNPVNGSHFFTKSTTERNDLVKAGWADEGVAFYVGK